jgi:NADPH-dependent 2,4-dienoyl-CoA reductase/sulfur reductase-like enzyme
VETPRPRRKRVVITGGGFAGIAAAQALRRADAEVVVIDRRNHHIFQPLLYQVAAAVLSPAEIAAPIRQLEAKRSNITVLLAEVIAIDVASRTIEASSPGVGVLIRLSGGRDRHATQLLRARRVRAICAGAQEPQRRRDDPSQNPGSNWPQRPRTRPNARDR